MPLPNINLGGGGGGCYSSQNLQMSSRLASFHGPSTPTSSPVQHKQRESTPTSPSRSRALLESTYHRKVRSSFQEIRAITETWDDLVLLDGLKAASQLINTRTELESASRIPSFEVEPIANLLLSL